MKGVKFGFMHSFDFLELILNSKEISMPEIKENKVDVEGSDGYVDYTYYYGEPKYKNRTLKFDFTIKPSKGVANYVSHYNTISGILHGTQRKITLDEDPDYYYFGTVYIGDLKNEKGIAIFQVICDCEPFRTKNIETVVHQQVSGSASVQLYNSRKRVVPTITTDAFMQFEFNGETYSRNAGTFKVHEIELKEGYNLITVTGTGNVSFAYAEGRL